MALAETIILFVTNLVASLNYFGLIILMAMESMVIPLPSEMVMPFAGFLVYQGKFSLLGVIFFSTLGTIIGSLISYYLGYYIGEPFFEKYGKYFLLNRHHLESTHKFFRKYGDKTIFISRFIPVIRHLISIPAGMSKMNIWKFSFYTILGGAIWNTFLTYLGIKLGEKWGIVHNYSQIIDVFIVAVIAGLIIYIFFKLYKTKKK